MVYRYLSQIRIVRTILTPQVCSQHFVRKFSTKLRKMEAVKTLKDLGYAFNSAGQLRKVGENGELTEQPFQFNISDNHQECQSHYEDIGNSITPFIYHLLETQESLIRLPVPKDRKDGTFIFVSEDYDKKDTLLVLIHGSGVVRAGQWARSLIINENIDYGSQIPYIRKAIAQNYGVLVMNTNDNFTNDGKKIPKSNSPEEHALYVWEIYVAKTKATSVLIVAHSYGGVVTVMLADKMKKDFEKRVKAIAFTDSVHGYSNTKISKHMKQITRNWISSNEPIDTPMKTPDYDVPRVSAGHPKHEMTSHSSINSVFNFFCDMLK
ncbi:FAM172 family protein homolog CG10038 [Pectinophora gossypiella]|nr:FAM172 family protein homolog CG10038 [Pectinophora gossypiella]